MIFHADTVFFLKMVLNFSILAAFLIFFNKEKRANKFLHYAKGNNFLD